MSPVYHASNSRSIVTVAKRLDSDLGTVGAGIRDIWVPIKPLFRQNDRLPKLLLQPLEEGGTEGRVPDLEALLSGAYREYGWDARTGRPLPETLEVLGLDRFNA